MKYSQLYPKLETSNINRKINIRSLFWEEQYKSLTFMPGLHINKENYLIVRNKRYDPCSMCGISTPFFLIFSEQVYYFQYDEFTQYMRDQGIELGNCQNSCSEECTAKFLECLDLFNLYKTLQHKNHE